MLDSNALHFLKSMVRADETLTFGETRKEERVHSIQVQARQWEIKKPERLTGFFLCGLCVQKLFSKGLWTAHEPLVCPVEKRGDHTGWLQQRVFCPAPKSQRSLTAEGLWKLGNLSSSSSSCIYHLYGFGLHLFESQSDHL